MPTSLMSERVFGTAERDSERSRERESERARERESKRSSVTETEYVCASVLQRVSWGQIARILYAHSGSGLFGSMWCEVCVYEVGEGARLRAGILIGEQMRCREPVNGGVSSCHKSPRHF